MKITIDLNNLNFNFKEVKEVPDGVMRAFFDNVKNEKMSVPLLLAGAVYTSYENELTQTKDITPDRLREVRGALQALRCFATVYNKGISLWQKSNKKLA